MSVNLESSHRRFEVKISLDSFGFESRSHYEVFINVCHFGGSNINLLLQFCYNRTRSYPRYVSWGWPRGGVENQQWMFKDFSAIKGQVNFKQGFIWSPLPSISTNVSNFIDGEQLFPLHYFVSPVLPSWFLLLPRHVAHVYGNWSWATRSIIFEAVPRPWNDLNFCANSLGHLQFGDFFGPTFNSEKCA